MQTHGKMKKITIQSKEVRNLGILEGVAYCQGYNAAVEKINQRKAEKRAAKEGLLTGTGCEPLKGLFTPIFDQKIESRIAKLESNDDANCEFVNVLRKRIEEINMHLIDIEKVLSDHFKWIQRLEKNEKDTIKTGDVVKIEGLKGVKSIIKVK